MASAGSTRRFIFSLCLLVQADACPYDVCVCLDPSLSPFLSSAPPSLLARRRYVRSRDAHCRTHAFLSLLLPSSAFSLPAFFRASSTEGRSEGGRSQSRVRFDSASKWKCLFIIFFHLLFHSFFMWLFIISSTSTHFFQISTIHNYVHEVKVTVERNLCRLINTHARAHVSLADL